MPDLTSRFLRGLRATLHTPGPRSRTLLLSHALVDPGLAMWSEGPVEPAQVVAAPATPPPSAIPPTADEGAAGAVAGARRG